METALAALVVSAVFFLSLWIIAKAANYFGVSLPFRPVEVTYDADEDGLLLNEVEEDLDGLEQEVKGLQFSVGYRKVFNWTIPWIDPLKDL